MKRLIRPLCLGLIAFSLAATSALAQRLTGTTPANFSTGVPTDTEVVFTFDSDMEPVQSISWFATGSGFPSAITGISYQWTGSRTLVATRPGGFPASTMIVWTLDEEGFFDELGFPLESGDQNSGFFTTGSGSGGGGGGGNEGTGVATISLVKFANYDQVSAADPVLATNFVYYFGANASAPESRGLATVTLTIPGGVVTNLISTPFVATNFFLSSFSNSLAGLEAKFPAGSYSFELQAPGSNQTVSVTLPGSALPGAPKLSNFAAGQTVDPSADFTLQFNAGGNSSELVHVSVYDTETDEYVYQSPDFPEAGYLIGSDTSVTLFAGALTEGRTYDVEIARWIASTNVVGGNKTSSALGSVTRTRIKTTGSGTTTEIVLSSPTFGSGIFSVQASLDANQSYVFERSVNTTTWEEVSTIFAVAATQTFIDFAPPAGNAIYRVRRSN